MIKYLCAAVFILITPIQAFAGGSDGSEVFGPVIKNPKASPKSSHRSPELGKAEKQQESSENKAQKSESSEKPAQQQEPDSKIESKQQEQSSDIKDSTKDNTDKKAGEGTSKDDSDTSGDEGSGNDKVSQDRFGCTPTPQIEPDVILMKRVKTSNNLQRKQGAVRRAKGKYITIVGRVVDEDCVPIQNASLKIWQTDSFGNYENYYIPKTDWDVVDKNYDPNFAYSGMAQTDNRGRYVFFTILPYSKDENAPHINFTVRHDKFTELSTRMFLKHHPLNDADPALLELNPKLRQLVLSNSRKADPTGQLDGRIYEFNITLEGVSDYREF